MAKVGYYCFDIETQVTPQTYDAAVLSANCALTAADLLQSTQKTAYALCRLPDTTPCGPIAAGTAT